MRYFLDTEFIDSGQDIDLISIGIVCEDGRELYLQSIDFAPHMANDWVRGHVYPHLVLCPHGPKTLGPALRHHYKGQCTWTDPDGGDITGPHADCPWRTRKQLRDDIQLFFNPGSSIELWGWCAGYDFVALCQLFGTMMDVPSGWPHYIRDLQYVLDERGMTDERLPPQENAHHALADARHIKRVWEMLTPVGPRVLFSTPLSIDGKKCRMVCYEEESS